MKYSHSYLSKILALAVSLSIILTTLDVSVYGLDDTVESSTIDNEDLIKEEVETEDIEEEEPVGETDLQAKSVNNVEALQSRIDALPSIEIFNCIRSEEEKQTLIEEASSICDVYYDELTEEEQALTNIDKVIQILETTYSVSLAASASEFDSTKSAEELVGSLLGSGITAENASKYGSLYFYSGSGNEFGISKGVVLSTDSKKASESMTHDEDLADLIINKENKTYSSDAHTAVLKFRLKATGTLLNFNYAFTSCEFDQSSTYNDIFGLFVSVNGSPYENIALLDNGKRITITNLKEGNYYTDYQSNRITTGVTDKTMNGVSQVFNAQKVVSKGDIVDIKFAIADVGDGGYDSMVIIEAGSLSFDAPGTKPDYSEETLTDFESGFTYEITVKNEDGTDGDTYLFEVGDGGTIPMTGTDKDGKSYDFIGKTISIVKKGDGVTTLDSDPQEVEISDRPETPDDPTASMDTPDDVNVSDVITSSTSIVVAAEEGIQYSIDGTTWKSPDEDGFVSFTDVIPNTVYKIYSRKAPTDSSPASDKSDGTEVTAKDIPVTLDSITTNGVITCPVAFVPNRWITTVLYNGEEPIKTANGEYIIIGDGEPHDLVLKDRAGNETTYSVTAFKSHKFSDYQPHPTDENILIAYCEHGCGKTNVIDKPTEGTDEDETPIKEKETTTAGGVLETDVKVEEGTPFTKVTGLTTDIARDIFLTPAEIYKLNTKEIEYMVWMDIKNLDLSENPDAKANIDTKALEINKNIVIGAYLDLTLIKSVTENGNTVDTPLVNVDTQTPLKIVINLPESLIAPKGKIRTYYIIRNHDNVAEVIDCTYNKNNQTLETSSSLFSEYAIAYVEKSVPAGGNTPTVDNPYNSGSASSNNTNILQPATTLMGLFVAPLNSQNNTKKSKEPKTGDKGTPLATVGMIAGFLYIIELFHEGKIGMTTEQKDAVVKAIIGWAKNKSKPIKYAAIILIMIVLAFYNSIGKKIEVEVENKTANAI